MSIARPLTEKERELILLSRDGKTGVAIATELGARPSTIQKRSGRAAHPRPGDAAAGAIGASGMTRSATFSENRKRRFDLIRDWRDEVGAPDRTALFVMLNPSKAGEKDDDPTVRKVVGFGRRWGFGRIVVVNLTPIVSTDPWALPPWNGIDMENRAITQAWMALANMVVVAWGSQPKAICHTIEFPELVYLFRQIAPVPLYCIGRTRNGAPLHPSRAPYTLTPELWEASSDRQRSE